MRRSIGCGASMSFLTSSMASAWSSVSSNGKASSSCRISSPSGGNAKPGHGLAGGVELQQLAGHLDHRRARPRLDRLPVRAAELVERGRGAGGADVAADLADLVVRDEDAVVALELEQQVVARDAGHGARLDAGEARDAVVLVDHVVARAHVEEGREARAAGEALLARRGAQQRALVDDGELEIGRRRSPRAAARRGSRGPGPASPPRASCSRLTTSALRLRSR